MTHVLIIISWLGGAVQGAAISTQEFSSAERCDAARLALIDYWIAGASGASASAPKQWTSPNLVRDLDQRRQTARGRIGARFLHA